jgi:hypothetical protein
LNTGSKNIWMSSEKKFLTISKNNSRKIISWRLNSKTSNLSRNKWTRTNLQKRKLRK